MLDAIREHRPTYSIGAITAYATLADAPGAQKSDFASLTKMLSGGAPIPPALNDRLEKRLGGYIHNAYGLTESTSATHVVRIGRRAPVDEAAGVLSIGVPVPSTYARILDDDGTEMPVGQPGELAISGPQIVASYLNNPEATARSLPDGELRTGDVGFRDEDGWFYLIDRQRT